MSYRLRSQLSKSTWIFLLITLHLFYAHHALAQGNNLYLKSLIDDLRHADSKVRAEAALNIGNHRPVAKEAVSDLRKVLREDVDENVRINAATALGSIGPDAKAAVRDLQDALKHQNSLIRSSAITAIQKIGQEAKAAIPDLQGLLKDTEQPSFVRHRAAEALGKVGPDAKVALPDLIAALHDKDEDVYKKAASAISEISVALAGAGDSNSISDLDAASKALLNSSDPQVTRNASIVQGNIEHIKLQQRWEVVQFVRHHLLICGVLAIYPTLLLCCLALLWKRPIAILQLNEAIPPSTDLRLPAWFGGVSLPLRHILLIGFFRYHPRVLDAWVAKHSASSRKVFSRKKSVEDREAHIPIPVIFNKRNVASLGPDDLRSISSDKSMCLLVWGEGGSGKTSLVCAIAKWAMAEDPANRLAPDRLMLPVLIEQDLEFQAGATGNFLLAAISDQIKLLINEYEAPHSTMIKHLLKRQRVLLIIDGFSEMNNASRSHILSGIKEIPANAVLITSRIDEPLTDLPKSSIKPMRIKGNKLSTFMEAYLAYKERREVFDDEEFFEACRRLSSIVGDRDITVLLAKYYAEQMIAAKEGLTDSDLPENIPDLMLKYINVIYNKPALNQPDIREVFLAAKMAAWQCLKQKYRPTPAPRDKVLAALGGNEKAIALLEYMERKLEIIQTVGALQDRIRFALDPLSEYLASLYLVSEYGKGEESWREFLATAERQEGAPEAIKGFLLALRDCCLCKKTDYEIPGFVAEELEKQVGINRDEKAIPLHSWMDTSGSAVLEIENGNGSASETKSSASLPKSHLTNDDGELKPQMLLEKDHSPTWPVEDPIEEAVNLLVRSLAHEKELSGLKAAYMLGKSGPAAVQVLTGFLQSPDSNVRRGALAALSIVGQDAEPAKPILLSMSQDQDRDVSKAAVDILTKMG